MDERLKIPGLDIGSEMSFEVSASEGAQLVGVLQRVMELHPVTLANEVETLVIESPGVIRFRTKGGMVGRVRKVEAPPLEPEARAT